MIAKSRTDLSVETFLVLRNRFFDAATNPSRYSLRDKLNTQDDPFDEYVFEVLETGLRHGVKVAKANGPLTTPDLAVYRPARCNRASRADLRSDPSRILGLEVKKLERQRSGGIARGSGLDYNTTPPCGTVRIYDLDDVVLDVKGYYLFVCQEPVPGARRTYRLTALALCDGDLLNADFDHYVSIVGRRSKEIGLGTYGDGANRVRPMMVFSNPLGAPFLDRRSTLIHTRNDLETEYPSLRRVGAIERTVPNESTPGYRLFHCYRDRRDAGDDRSFHKRDPFPIPRRSDRTVARGRFIVHVRPSR